MSDFSQPVNRPDMSISERIDIIRKRPLMFIQEKNLRLLSAFLDGYYMAQPAQHEEGGDGNTHSYVKTWVFDNEFIWVSGTLSDTHIVESYIGAGSEGFDFYLDRLAEYYSGMTIDYVPQLLPEQAPKFREEELYMQFRRYYDNIYSLAQKLSGRANPYVYVGMDNYYHHVCMYARADGEWERCEVPKESREDKLRLICLVSEIFSVLFELGIECYVLTLAPQEYRPEAKLTQSSTDMTLQARLAEWVSALPDMDD